MATRRRADYNRPTSALMAIRVEKETRAGIERISKALNESMSSLVDKALRRAIALYDRPHLATLVDSIVTLALRIEQEGVNVASDPDASRQFHDGIAKILETTIAAPSEESEDVKVHAWIDAEAAMSLVRAGVDWSRGRK